MASYGVFSRGINIRNIHNIIFASPYKSIIKVLQSIGRGLRKHHSKKYLTVFDIADDLSSSSKDNNTLGHFIERIKIYIDQDFEYTIKEMDID